MPRKIKAHKISIYAMWSCLAVAALIFGAGATFGYDDIVGDVLINIILWLLYLLTAVATGFVLFNCAKSIAGLTKAMRGKDRKRQQIGQTNILASGVLIASIAVGAIVALVSKDDSLKKATAGEQICADIFVVSLLIMIACTIAAVLLNSSGVLRKKNSKTDEKKA